MRQSALFRFIVGIDQAFNPLVYGGSEDVTISAQTAYNEILFERNIRRRKTIDWLFLKLFGEVEHCMMSLVAEIDEFPMEREALLAGLRKRGIIE